MKRGLLVLAALFTVAAADPNVAKRDGKCDEGALPQKVGESLRAHRPGWKVVSEQDLAEDDRRLWKEAHPSECPGFIEGQFDGVRKTSYAFNLIRRANGHLYETLIILGVDRKGSHLTVLSRAREIARASVIVKVPPGQYEDAEGSTRTTVKFSAISFEAIEAGAILYYWSDGRYRSLQTSE